jgi:cell division transport system ATP-binding protein
MNDFHTVILDNATIYRNTLLVLSQISMHLQEGEFAYLIGKTGSGKTSLLKALYAELPTEEGTALILGYDLRTIKDHDIPFLRRKLGIVFQDFQLLTDRSLQANLEFVLKATGWRDKKKMQERIHEVLTLVDMPCKGFRMPHELSGGEQQRACIARALLNKPQIILADEPTGNLDPETSSGIVNLLHEISHLGTTVLMATHNHFLIQKFPARCITLDKGRIITIEEGRRTKDD